MDSNQGEGKDIGVGGKVVDVAKHAEDRPRDEEGMEPEELEMDSPEDGRPRLAAGAVAISASETTVNVLQTCNGKVLMSLGDGGFQHLLAAARVNTGVKAGRYLFEVRMVESRTQADLVSPHIRQNTLLPRQLLRIGVCAPGASLFLGNQDSIGFDSEGSLLSDKSIPKANVVKKFAPCCVVGLLLNLDVQSRNAGTVSLFLDGVRACQPQALPEGLKGKTLFPMVNYKNMTIYTNFGPKLWAPLPFTCRTLADAAKSDTTPTEIPKPKGEVLFPIGIPDEGTFDWLDDFLARNPQYAELSERRTLAWAEKSGIYRPKGYSSRHCNDRPGLDFGVRELDDNSVHRQSYSLVPALRRDYVVMEVRNNLLATERQKSLAHFADLDYKKVAVVVMGEPPGDFKKKVHDGILAEKREKVAAEVRHNRIIEDQKKDAEKARVERDRADAKREVEAAKKEKADKKREEQEKVVAEKKGPEEQNVDNDGNEKDREEGEKKEVDKKEPVGAADKKEKEGQEADKEAEGEEEEEVEAEEPDTADPEEDKGKTLEEAIQEALEAVELTEAEKQSWFRLQAAQASREVVDGPALVTDMTANELGHAFSNFTLPGKEDGFDEIRYLWNNEETCAEYLRAWILDRKMTQRVEDLQPGPWFKEQQVAWHKVYQEWYQKYSIWRDPDARARSQAKKREESKMKIDAEKRAEASDDKKEENEEDTKSNNDEKMEVTIDPEDLDVFLVEDVCDVGNNGEPLFARWVYEDWALLSLRWELHTLVHAFRHDMNDPERSSFHESHVPFYHHKYFRNDFNVTIYGVRTVSELLRLVDDCVETDPKSRILEPQLSDDTPLENFVKLTEDHRRERQRNLDAGDETAVLKFLRPPPRGQGMVQQHGQQQHHRGGYGQMSQGMGSRMAPPRVDGRRGPPLGESAQDTRMAGRARRGYTDYNGGPQRHGGMEPPSVGMSGRSSGYSSGYGSGGHAPPASSRYGGHSGGGGSGVQKRPYAAQSSSYPPSSKQSRSSYGGPPSSRGSYTAYGSSGYGSGGGSGYGGGYGRR